MCPRVYVLPSRLDLRNIGRQRIEVKKKKNEKNEDEYDHGEFNGEYDVEIIILIARMVVVATIRQIFKTGRCFR